MGSSGSSSARKSSDCERRNVGPVGTGNGKGGAAFLGGGGGGVADYGCGAVAVRLCGINANRAGDDMEINLVVSG